jgi:phenylpropionate dioxygenase-like ring-hydroxylating dioxygenase large terminal subunit
MPQALKPVNRVVWALVAFFLLFALTIDLYWLLHYNRLPELAASSWVARLYRNYSSADHAYYDRVTKFEVALETLNVWVTPLFYAWLLVALYRRKPYRYPLQLAIGSWVAYSVALDCWIALISGYPGMQEHTPANFFKFYAANAPWLIGHLYLVFDAARNILAVLATTDAPLRRRPAPVRAVPGFENARSLRQKARAAGLHPNYWYAVEQDRAVKKGQVVETTFWNEPIALFRTEGGELAAIENRCAHRQMKLSLGEVQDCRLVCAYHGWSYDCRGAVDAIPHDLFGRTPRFQVKSYPVKVRYGLIWIFPGDPGLAEQTPLPSIPELEGPGRWACIPIEFIWKAHHSIILDNLSDLTHAHLHRDFQPFSNPVLIRHETRGDSVYCQYRVTLLEGPMMKRLLDRNRPGMDLLELCIEYPYQWGNTGGSVRHWVFLLPVDERTTKIFFLFYFNHIKVPFTPLHFPQRLMTWVLRIMNPIFIKPLVSQDGEAVGWEQLGYEKYFDAPPVELNPAVPMFQQLVVRKWEEYLAGARRDPAEHKGRSAAEAAG